MDSAFPQLVNPVNPSSEPWRPRARPCCSAHLGRFCLWRFAPLSMHGEVSLGTVREALSRLGAEGLVIAESQKGYRVGPLSVEDLRDLTEVRVEIERIALARAIASGDLDWETNLVAARHRLSRISERVEGDPHHASDQWAQAHGAFHEALVKACGSAKLLQIRAQLYQQTERYRRFSDVVGRERNVFAEHQRIFDATIARDSTAATNAIAEHLYYDSLLRSSPARSSSKSKAMRDGDG